MTATAKTVTRRDVYTAPLVDGRASGSRFRRAAYRLLVSAGEREEAGLDRRLRTHPGVTRPNTIALISPKGGVGKTTSTFVVGNLLASHLNLRVIAVDANPDFGTLSHLASDAARSPQTLADVLENAERLRTAAELRSYVSRLPSGLHVLGAPRHPDALARLGPDRYGELVAYLSCFYDMVLLDLGTGVGGPLARFAVERADQVVLVTTPEWVTSSVVVEALEHLPSERTTVAINKSLLRPAEVQIVQQRFQSVHLHRCTTIPQDEQLGTMLDTATYSLEALARPSRMAIKGLGVAVTERLV